MKKIKITFRLLAIVGALAFTFTACSDEDNFLNADDQTVVIDDGSIDADGGKEEHDETDRD